MDTPATCTHCAGRGSVSIPHVLTCTRCGGQGKLSPLFMPASAAANNHAPWERECLDCEGTGLRTRIEVVTCRVCGGEGQISIDHMPTRRMALRNRLTQPPKPR